LRKIKLTTPCRNVIKTYLHGGSIPPFSTITSHPQGWFSLLWRRSKPDGSGLRGDLKDADMFCQQTKQSSRGRENFNSTELKLLVTNSPYNRNFVSDGEQNIPDLIPPFFIVHKITPEIGLSCCLYYAWHLCIIYVI